MAAEEGIKGRGLAAGGRRDKLGIGPWIVWNRAQVFSMYTRTPAQSQRSADFPQETVTYCCHTPLA